MSPSPNFLTNKRTRKAFVPDRTASIDTFFDGRSMSEIAKATKNSIDRQERKHREERRLKKHSDIDPASIKGDSLNSYIEASRVKSLDQF